MTGGTAAGGQADVLFVCDFDPGFTGEEYHGRGVGGTEALVVLLAEECARRGRRVVVGTRAPVSAEHRGVRYVPMSSVSGWSAQVAVLVKQWSEAAATLGQVRVFLATDVHVPDRAGIRRCRGWAGRVFALSAFQRSRLLAATGAGAIDVAGAPVPVDDYPTPIGPRGRVLLYCSVPDRGLYYLKDLFPAIRRSVPDATLVITSDFTLWARPEARSAFVRFFAGQPGVEYVGHVSRTELVRRQRQARVMAYPCVFEEGFCIAAAECMAAGAVPVTTRGFALTTTVGDAGVLVRGHPRFWLYRRAFVRHAVRLLMDDEAWMASARACREHVSGRFRPGHVVDRMQLLDGPPHPA